MYAICNPTSLLHIYADILFYSLIGTLPPLWDGVNGFPGRFTKVRMNNDFSPPSARRRKENALTASAADASIPIQKSINMQHTSTAGIDAAIDSAARFARTIRRTSLQM